MDTKNIHFHIFNVLGNIRTSVAFSEMLWYTELNYWSLGDFAMPKKTQMTDRIYEYLRDVIPQQGYAPSVREICEAVGLKSPSTVHF